MRRSKESLINPAISTDPVLILKEGAQVMFVRNDPSKAFVNGSIGKIASLSKEKILVELDRQGSTKKTLRWHYRDVAR
ncbi:MAG: hypothetical protein IPO69_20450 [Saprospiraceae bacterium]|nr:hypothetical protein [Saprospiraceae bacterium]